MFDWLRFRRDGSELRIDPRVMASVLISVGALLCSTLSMGALTLFEPDGKMFVSSLWVMLMGFVWLSYGVFLYSGLLSVLYTFQWLVAERFER